jgi:hypothetical protein
MIVKPIMVFASMSFQELRLDRMSRSFGTFNALREINLTIRKGELSHFSALPVAENQPLSIALPVFLARQAAAFISITVASIS